MPDTEKSWQLILPDGSRLMEGEAVVTLFQTIDGLKGLGRLLETLRLTGLVGAVYRVVSAIRPSLGWMFRDAPGPRRLP